ncbi:hypothetical protein ACLOJK_030411 [Asimina triloba]
MAHLHHRFDAHEKQSASSIKPAATIQQPGSSVRHTPAAPRCSRTHHSRSPNPFATISLPPKPSVPSSIQVDDRPLHAASSFAKARARSNRPSKTHHQDP